MKLKLLTALLLCINYISAQQPFLNVKIEDKISSHTIKNAFFVQEKGSNSLFTFLEEEKITYGFKYNGDKTLVSKLSSKGLKRKYKKIIASLTDGDKVRLIETNNKNTKYASILFDFETKRSEEIEYDFKLGIYEYYLQSYSHKDVSYIFSYNSTTNELYKWSFFMDGSFKKDSYALDLNYNKSSSLSQNSLNYEFQKVNNKLPNDLIIASKRFKMYENENGFIWTLDDNIAYTLIIECNAPEFSPKFSKLFKYKTETKAKTTNSYIFEDKIAQVVSNNSYLAFEIKNLNSNDIIKSVSIKKDDSIDFKNGPILQEGSVYSFGNIRTMEKTSKFLRKMSSEKNGISIFKMPNDNYRVTIGGVRAQGGGAPMMMPGFGGIPIGQFGAVTMSFNPAGFAYGNYNSTGSTRIECLFDSSFNHVKGKIPDNVFDRIDEYKDKLSKSRAEDVFFIDNKVLFGFYQPAIKTYQLIQFE